MPSKKVSKKSTKHARHAFDDDNDSDLDSLDMLMGYGSGLGMQSGASSSEDPDIDKLSLNMMKLWAIQQLNSKLLRSSSTVFGDLLAMPNSTEYNVRLRDLIIDVAGACVDLDPSLKPLTSRDEMGKSTNPVLQAYANLDATAATGPIPISATGSSSGGSSSGSTGGGALYSDERRPAVMNTLDEVLKLMTQLLATTEKGKVKGAANALDHRIATQLKDGSWEMPEWIRDSILETLKLVKRGKTFTNEEYIDATEGLKTVYRGTGLEGDVTKFSNALGAFGKGTGSYESSGYQRQRLPAELLPPLSLDASGRPIERADWDDFDKENVYQVWLETSDQTGQEWMKDYRFLQEVDLHLALGVLERIKVMPSTAFQMLDDEALMSRAEPTETLVWYPIYEKIGIPRNGDIAQTLFDGAFKATGFEVRLMDTLRKHLEEADQQGRLRDVVVPGALQVAYHAYYRPSFMA